MIYYPHVLVAPRLCHDFNNSQAINNTPVKRRHLPTVRVNHTYHPSNQSSIAPPPWNNQTASSLIFGWRHCGHYTSRAQILSCHSNDLYFLLPPLAICFPAFQSTPENPLRKPSTDISVRTPKGKSSSRLAVPELPLKDKWRRWCEVVSMLSGRGLLHLVDSLPALQE